MSPAKPPKTSSQDGSPAAMRARMARGGPPLAPTGGGPMSGIFMNPGRMMVGPPNWTTSGERAVNHRRLLEPIGYVPPAEYDARSYEQAAVA